MSLLHLQMLLATASAADGVISRARRRSIISGKK